MSGSSTSTTAAAGFTGASRSMAARPRFTVTGVQPSDSTRRARSVSSSWLSSTSRIVGAGIASGTIPAGQAADQRPRHVNTGHTRRTVRAASPHRCAPRTAQTWPRPRACAKKSCFLCHFGGLMLRFPRALPLVVAALAVLACEKKKPEGAAAPAPGGAAAPAAGDRILLGHVGSLTGSEATFGDSTDKGIQLAIEEVNAKGGVKGKPLALKTY